MLVQLAMQQVIKIKIISNDILLTSYDLFILANTVLSPGIALLSTFTVNVACTSYIRIAWLYTAQSTNQTISIATYNVPSGTQIDGISIIDTTTSQELIANGGFENGTNGWSGGAVGSIAAAGGNCYAGSWCYSDGATGPHGAITQSVSTTVGRTLSVSFYIKWGGTGTIYNLITITP